MKKGSMKAGRWSTEVVFSFVKRAHGIMPSLSERQLLMKNVQFIAGFSINYTKFIDDITHNL